MSFIKTIFPATKRRKTEANTFVHPTPPQEFAGQHHHQQQQQQQNATMMLPITLQRSPSTSVPKGALFDSLCVTCDRELRPDMLRMVLLEAEQRVLFDTASVVPIDNRILPPNAQLSTCKKFQLLKRRRDIPTISQMLFGAMPTALGSDAFKIHTITEDQRLLISRIFGIPRINSRDMRGAVDSLDSSDSESQSQYITDVSHLRFLQKLSNECEMQVCNSKTTPMKLVRFHRRLQQDCHVIVDYRCHIKTSLCETVWKSRSRLSSCGSQTDDEHTRQVGLGILLNTSEKDFLFQHIPLVEAEISRLEMHVTNAATNSSTFFINVNKAWQDFCESICLLHNAPRLRHPVWLSLLECDQNENFVVADFCQQLMRLVEKLDTKHTKFFLSNVVSTVLMHHMSWVASVAPPLHAPTHLQEKNLLVGSIHNDEAPYMPYNAQIAQYLEISGSVGSAHRMAKTVVSGVDCDLIASILQVLSYFIRCSAIHQKE
ncbi:hypothetical protein KIN20_025253 [Parelaphostrongylus tenuis]|uniref:Folliculin-interacting protein middle domain-containing protein n=1 Tax=Parelaphostrongylus tenuis TaxID=148309 RepID=A0AAD5MUY4_PARTN|nr:hypothetical protein KIN20_025253 [Parelaphostrongylus tenuis]